MQLLYEGTDITDEVQIESAQAYDSAGGRADELEVRFSNVQDWLNWEPKAGDRLEIVDSGYTTGVMCLGKVLPDGDGMTLGAYSMPVKARERRFQSYEKVTLYELMSLCAAELGMEIALYGVDANARYRYLERRDEGVSGFLSRVLGYEGAVLKFCDGKLLAIGIEWAQAQSPAREMEMTLDMPGAMHLREDGRGFARLSIRTPYGEGTAVDADFAAGREKIIQDVSVFGGAQAARWARGLLLMENRQIEKLRWDLDFDAGMTALVRLDVSGLPNVQGQWLIEGAMHDFVERKTGIVALRCRENIH